MAFSKHQPDIGYTQGMNFLAALILIGVGIKEKLCEEYAFYILIKLLETPEKENNNYCL